MRAWIDLANSPHVAVMAPIVDALENRGFTILLTARDHAQTVGLAVARWPETVVIGSESPAGRIHKGWSVLARAESLRQFARTHRADIVLTHGSYAQLLASRALRIPAVTMMDYEHQPANHVSFRLAERVIVPSVFPSSSLSRSGARGRKVVRYEGYKEELYLAGFTPDADVVGRLGLDPERVVAVLRPPPHGALYHRSANPRFEEILEALTGEAQVQVVLLPRTADQQHRYGALNDVLVPSGPVDGLSLLAGADLTVGAGGTMNRESALIGTPTYTIFAGRLSAVDTALVREGRMVDLRDHRGLPPLVKKNTHGRPEPVGGGRARAILETVVQTVVDLARERRRSGT